MTGHRTRIPALDHDAHVAAMLLPVRPDATDLAPVMAAGAYALDRLPATEQQRDRILAGLSPYAHPQARVEALVAWSAAAAGIDATRGRYWVERELLGNVLVGLTPGMRPADREAHGADLTQAAARLAELDRYDRDGTVPPHLPAGVAVQVGVLAEQDLAAHDQRWQAAVLAASWDGGTR